MRGRTDRVAVVAVVVLSLTLATGGPGLVQEGAVASASPAPEPARVQTEAPGPTPVASRAPVVTPSTEAAWPTNGPSPNVAPEPTPASLRGVASWYCLPGRSPCTAGWSSSGAYAAAGPALRALLGPGWSGRRVRVEGQRGGSLSVVLIDWCACPGGRIVDLYAAAFRVLAPLDAGLVEVEIVAD